jgi:hypothetical protein
MDVREGKFDLSIRQRFLRKRRKTACRRRPFDTPLHLDAKTREVLNQRELLGTETRRLKQTHVVRETFVCLQTETSTRNGETLTQ